jgi:protein TonB
VAEQSLEPDRSTTAPVEPQLPATVQSVRVGGNIAAPRKIKDVQPVYPAIAQSARVSGIVIVEATIGTDGRVTDARILRSIPLLDAAALDAVRQWEFTTTLLNGAPTSIVMSVTVNFRPPDTE